MSTGEEEEHLYQAIIKALTKALTDIKGSPMDSLKPPTFDWNSHQNSLKIFSSSSRAWRVGTHSKVYLTKMVIPHNWNICSISWVQSDEGSTSSGTLLAQLQRNERRIRRVPSSLWSFYIAPWITLYLRDTGYTSWKRSG